MVLLVILIQRPFNNHIFEFGNIKTISGTYYQSPFPMLVADPGSLPDNLSPNVLLVGFGKFGAEGIMDQVKEEKGQLTGRIITLAGTLIYGDGKTLLELTDETASILEVSEEQVALPDHSFLPVDAKMTGEIIDPKCYFGVMKPGEGKVHKSCAIRCISGGIPPVFKQETGDPDNPFQYYLMLDEQGNTINKDVLPFVAEKINISGKTKQIMGWDVIYVDLERLKG